MVATLTEVSRSIGFGGGGGGAAAAAAAVNGLRDFCTLGAVTEGVELLDSVVWVLDAVNCWAIGEVMGVGSDSFGGLETDSNGMVALRNFGPGLSGD